MVKPESVFNLICFDYTPKKLHKWYALWNNKIFVNKTAKGNKWLYNGKGKVRRAIIEAIEEYTTNHLSKEITDEFEVVNQYGGICLLKLVKISNNG